MADGVRWYDYVTINAFWFALTVRAQALGGIVIPLLVQRFVGEAQKGHFFGTIRLWALMTALLTQAAMGIVSDRSRSRWGRRRPLVVGGAAVEVLVLALLVGVARLEGSDGYWALGVLYVVSSIASNTAQAAEQGLIPDLVPVEKRGLFSGLKALLEVPLPLFFASAVIGPLVSRGEMRASLVAVMGVLLAGAGMTMFVREAPLREERHEVDAGALLRLVLMTTAFASVIIGIGGAVRAILRWTVPLAAWQATMVAAAIGIAGMLLAVVFGVLVCVRIAVGHRAQMQKAHAFTWWVVNRLAFLVAANGLSGFMLYFLQERFAELQAERAAGPASGAVMVVGVFVLLTAVPSGWVADRVGKRALVALSGIIAAVGMTILLLVPTMATIYLGGSLIGIAVGLFFTTNWALGTEVIPQEEAGRYLGLANLAGAGAGAIGAYIGGPIADHSSYVLVYAIYGSLFLASVLALGGLPVGERAPVVAGRQAEA